MTVREIDEQILAQLPATYGQLCAKLGADRDRVIDRALQRLRKRGVIAFVRKGRSPVWSKT